MFKVICINASLDPNEFPYRGFELKENEIYTVIADVIGFDVNNDPVKCYRLAEDSTFDLYRQAKFIPLSSIDERTIQKQRELDAIINVFSFEHSI